MVTSHGNTIIQFVTSHLIHISAPGSGEITTTENSQPLANKQPVTQLQAMLGCKLWLQPSTYSAFPDVTVVHGAHFVSKFVVSSKNNKLFEICCE